MKIPGSGEKANLTLLDNEAVKVNTKSSAQAAADRAASAKQTITGNPDNSAENGISVKLGLAKHLNEELDPEKIALERQQKVALIKNKIAEGGVAAYLNSVPSEELASKLLQEAQVEHLEAGKIAGNE